MAIRKVNESSLVAVADAIREKSGTTEQLAFPDGFVGAVEAISAGGGFATGTFTVAEQTSNTTEFKITHNLGVVPTNVLWFIETATSLSSTYLIGASKMAMEFISPNAYTASTSSDSDATSKSNMRYFVYPSGANRVYTATNANETDLRLFFPNGYRASGAIPAGSTVRWIVW